MIIDILSFCHYSGFWGYLLGLFQYVPIGLFIGVFFWNIVHRDSFFLSLGITMKITWIFGIIFKYFIIPYWIPMTTFNSTILCDNYIPTFTSYIISLFFDKNTIMVNASSFPNIDVLQTGSYMGFILTYCLFWKYPLTFIPTVGIIALCFVPWSFLSTGTTNILIISVSVYIGIVSGAFGLFISYYIYYTCIFDMVNEDQDTQNKKQLIFKKKCFSFWCGYYNSNNSSLYLYKNSNKI